jgi:hypothetical protein
VRLLVYSGPSGSCSRLLRLPHSLPATPALQWESERVRAYDYSELETTTAHDCNLETMPVPRIHVHALFSLVVISSPAPPPGFDTGVSSIPSYAECTPFSNL